MIRRAMILALAWTVARAIAPAAFTDAPLLSLAAIVLYALAIGWAIWPAIARLSSDPSANQQTGDTAP